MENITKELYNDKKLDVLSLLDLKDDKITILSKNENNISFEYLKDFWKYENNVLTQYPDFLSLKENKNGIEVFNQENNNVVDYGASIVNSINNISFLKSIKDFSLEDRLNYIKSEVEKSNPAIPFTIDKNFKYKKAEVSQLVEKVTAPLESQELKPLRDLSKNLLESVIMLCAFYKSVRIKNMNKNKLINDILLKMDSNDIDKNSLLEMDNLIKQNPELKNVLKKYEEFEINLKGDKKSIANKMVNKALNDDELLNIADKIADNKDIKNKIEEEINNLKKFYQKVKDNINPDILNSLSTLGLKEQNLMIDKIKEYDLFKLFYENNLDPKNYNDQMETFLSSCFIIGAVNEDILDYESMLTKYVGIIDDLENKLSPTKIADISTNMIENILPEMNIIIKSSQIKNIKR